MAAVIVPPVCLVVLCYNEHHRLNVRAFTSFLQACPQVAFCFVDDGSRDGTSEVLDALASDNHERVCVLALPANVGKAEAVRLGMRHALGWKPFDYV